MLKKINDEIVDKIPTKKTKKLSVLGGNCVGLYDNVFLVARKKSGKTTVLYHLLKNCVDSETKVLIFCSTVNKDDSYKGIRKMLDKKNVQYMCFTSIKDDNGKSILNDFIKEENIEEENEENEKKVEKQIFCRFDEPPKIEEKKQKKKKKNQKNIAQKLIFIFDDIGDELRDRSISQLLKINRHLKAKTIMSSQYLNDLNPASRRQIDCWLIFKNISDEKLKNIHNVCNSCYSFEKFKKMYVKCVSKPFGFFYINSMSDDYRSCFSKKFV